MADIRIRELFARKDDNETLAAIQTARRLVYEEGVKFTSKAVTEVLGPMSLNATQNAFSVRLRDCGFDFHSIIAPDLMHEFELGVFKSFFTHLLRIIHSLGDGKIQTLNQRFRDTPTFGRDTIRKFSYNVSALFKLRACDWENILCSIPVVNGLLPAPHGVSVRKLLFELCTWHSLAKLRSHTEITVRELEASTFRLGKAMRHFEQTTCKAFATTELPNEETARRKKKKMPNPESKGKDGARKPTTKLKQFNLTTFKFHGLGHYAAFIRQVGTSDNFTSQTMEVQHKNPKLHSKRASRSKTLLSRGISKQQIRERTIYLMKQRRLQGKRKQKANPGVGSTWFSFFDSEKLPRTDPAVHHHMSKETQPANRIHLLQWTLENTGDPAVTGFIRRLRSYFLAKLLKVEFDDDETQFSDNELSSLIIVDDIIYRHKVLRVNYTTYDLRRQQDSLNPRTQADVMLLSNDESGFPYWYARILGIFHARVIFVRPDTGQIERHEFEFLWVRWLGLNSSPRFGWKAKNLPRVGFINERVDNSPAFGFIDPSQVIRAVHLIPDETGGKSKNGLLRPTIARKSADNDLDWNYFFVNIFADRDTFMRYRGGGLGHSATGIRNATNHFLQDRDDIDARFRAGLTLDTVTPGGDLEYEDDSGVMCHRDLQDDSDQDGWADSELGDSDLEEQDSDSELEGQDEVNQGAGAGYSEDELEYILDDALGPEDGEDEEGEWGKYGFACL